MHSTPVPPPDSGRVPTPHGRPQVARGLVRAMGEGAWTGAALGVAIYAYIAAAPVPPGSRPEADPLIDFIFLSPFAALTGGAFGLVAALLAALVLLVLPRRVRLRLAASRVGVLMVSVALAGLITLPLWFGLADDTSVRFVLFPVLISVGTAVMIAWRGPVVARAVS